MDPEAKQDLAKIQQSIWKLEQARLLLNDIDGMDLHTDSLTQQIDWLQREMEELHQIG